VLLLSVYYGGYPYTAPTTAARSDLAILDLHSGRLRFVTTDHDKLNNYGRWSRDARWIVFQSDRHAPPFRDSTATHYRFDSLEIYIVRPDGLDLRRLTTNTYFDAHPSW
jgi:Tol biopolymer transport system component